MFLSKESPEYLRLSLAAAISLGLAHGRFFRNASPGCINVLLTYARGCRGNCAYCGLSRDRIIKEGKETFIRVDWPVIETDTVIGQMKKYKNDFRRTCISMVTNRRAIDYTLLILERIKENIECPISVLVAPSILKRENLIEFKKAGADRIGVAIDCATPELFARYRGNGVKGPHQWEKYLNIFQEAVEIFGRGKVGSHLIVGLGETEKEMASMFQKVKRMGGTTHLFSFYPEKGSFLEDLSPCPAPQYRRMQVARYLIDNDLSSFDRMKFNERNEVIDFGIDDNNLKEVIKSGKPFLTSGCPGDDGILACNRPYGDSRPSDIRSFPFLPDKNELKDIISQLFKY